MELLLPLTAKFPRAVRRTRWNASATSAGSLRFYELGAHEVTKHVDADKDEAIAIIIFWCFSFKADKIALPSLARFGRPERCRHEHLRRWLGTDEVPRLFYGQLKAPLLCSAP